MNEKKKFGLFIGKFLPPHIGHLMQIKKCLNECETLFVVVADSKSRTRQICKTAGVERISAKRRLRWLKKCLSEEKNLKFIFLSQGMLEAYPTNLDYWKLKLQRALKTHIDVWFVDKNFLKVSEDVFPEFYFSGFDRSEINISATEIRSNLSQNIKYIIPPARKTFQKYLRKDKRIKNMARRTNYKN